MVSKPTIFGMEESYSDLLLKIELKFQEWQRGQQMIMKEWRQHQNAILTGFNEMIQALHTNHIVDEDETEEDGDEDDEGAEICTATNNEDVEEKQEGRRRYLLQNSAEIQMPSPEKQCNHSRQGESRFHKLHHTSRVKRSDDSFLVDEMDQTMPWSRNTNRSGTPPYMYQKKVKKKGKCNLPCMRTRKKQEMEKSKKIVKQKRKKKNEVAGGPSSRKRAPLWVLKGQDIQRITILDLNVAASGWGPPNDILANLASSVQIIKESANGDAKKWDNFREDIVKIEDKVVMEGDGDNERYWERWKKQFTVDEQECILISKSNLKIAFKVMDFDRGHSRGILQKLDKRCTKARGKETHQLFSEKMKSNRFVSITTYATWELVERSKHIFWFLWGQRNSWGRLCYNTHPIDEYC